MSKNKSKSIENDDFAKPSDAPAGGDGFKLTEEGRDRLLLITPHREEEVPAYGKAGKNGERQRIIVADVVVIDEKNPAKSEEHEDVWIFPAYVQGSLRGYIGERRVLGRLRNTEDTSGEKSAAGGYYWVLEDATKKDVEKATAYREALNNPIKGGLPKSDKKAKAAPAKADKKSKAEPPAKGKKAKVVSDPNAKPKAKGGLKLGGRK